jgi:hypothetical protein
MRAISGHRWRGSSAPLCLPAWDHGWQGNPPATTSTRPRHGLPSNSRMSANTGNGGRHPSACRASKTRRQYLSISTAQTGVCPSSMPPRMPPPAPANRWSSRRESAARGVAPEQPADLSASGLYSAPTRGGAGTSCECCDASANRADLSSALRPIGHPPQHSQAARSHAALLARILQGTHANQLAAPGS